MYTCIYIYTYIYIYIYDRPSECQHLVFFNPLACLMLHKPASCNGGDRSSVPSISSGCLAGKKYATKASCVQNTILPHMFSRRDSLLCLCFSSSAL